MKRILKYYVTIVPMDSQTNAQFKLVIKPRSKVFTNLDAALDYNRYCQLRSKSELFQVEFGEYFYNKNDGED